MLGSHWQITSQWTVILMQMMKSMTTKRTLMIKMMVMTLMTMMTLLVTRLSVFCFNFLPPSSFQSLFSSNFPRCISLCFPIRSLHDVDDDADDDIYIMMQCLFVCHEKWALPLQVCDFLSENVWVKIFFCEFFFLNFFFWKFVFLKFVNF